MNVTEPVATEAGLHPAPSTTKEWLDALAGGACDQHAFFAAVDVRLQTAPDDGWDLLGLVDQYYRRGKIGADLFGRLKSHLQTLLVGNGTHVEMSVPVPLTPLDATVAVQMRDVPWVDATVAVPAAGVPTIDPPIIDPPIIDPPIIDTAIDASPIEAAAPAAPHGIATSRPSQTEPRAPAVGTVLRGRYRIQGLLGRGGMGTVYAAVDQFRLDGGGGDQRVALKILHTEVLQRPRLFAELRREFQHLQSLSHPNVVRVHEFDRDGDLAFFTMEYLSGTVLSRVLAANASAPMRREHALSVIRDVGAAVVHAHSRGVVHGDLNPGNIFITDDGQVRVLDFGASHQLHRGPWISDFGADRPVAVATLSYASCQVLEGEVADARDDVYALACIMYRLLTGRHPFHDATALKARSSHLQATRPDGLDRRQWRDLRLGLRFERERRPTDVRAWLDRLNLRGAAAHLPSLQTLLTDRPPRRSSARAIVIGIALALAVAGGWTATHVESVAGAGAEVGARLKTLLGTDAGSVPPEKPDAESAQTRVDVNPPAAVTTPVVRPPAAVTTPVVRPPTAVTTPVVRPPAAISTRAVPASTAAGAPAVRLPVAARAHIELSADNVTAVAGEPAAIVPIHRTRNLRDDVTFKWWTESGTAKPSQDFVPVAPRIEHLQPGQSTVNLAVPVVADPNREATRNFYVVIDQAGDAADDSAAVGPRTLTMVSIPAAAR